MNKETDNRKIVYRVSGVSIGANTLLSIGKVLVGIFANSGAMITDGIHSASDVLSTFVLLIGTKFSSSKEDKSHEYGHERMECIAALVLGTILFGTALSIGWSGIKDIFSGDYENLAIPGIAALIAAGISILTKEALYWYSMKNAKKIDSVSLKAQALDHRSDAISSVGALIGVGGARMGYAILDPIASLVICVFIGKAAYDIFKDATNKLTDHSCNEELENKIKGEIEKIPGVYSVDSLKTRLFGSRIYVETEISADHNITFDKSHEIAEQAHRTIEKEFPLVKHCTVQINPINLETI